VPGLHFTHSLIDDLDADRYDAALKSLLHDSEYSVENIIRDQGSRADLTRYAQYPVEIYDSDGYLFIIEGRLHNIFGKQPLDTLRELVDNLLPAEPGACPPVRRWLLEHDGEFNLLIRDKSLGRWAFVNDMLGRLPVYFYQHSRGSCLSRELRFITRLFELTEFDRRATAEYLLFGYPLGRRTLLENIRRLPGGTLLQWRDNDPVAARHTYGPFDFSRKRSVAGVTEAAGELADLFVQAGGSQANQKQAAIISLSGGLDSRAVAAGLVRAGRTFKALTFENAGGTFGADSIRAREVAERLNLDWDLFRLPPVTGNDLRRIIRMKGGMNYVASASALPFMAQIEKRHGRDLVYFSGDGGDKLLPDLRPGRRPRSVMHLAEYVIDRHALLPTEFVACLTGVPEEEILAGIVARLHAYPESTTEQKYVHFMIYERAMKWLFEGEDCNRCHFWTATPFYSLPFFMAAMSLPDELKTRHLLYREFLVALSREAAAIPDASCGLPVTSRAYRERLRLIGWLSRYPGLLKSVKRVATPSLSYSYESATIRAIVALTELPGVGDRIDSAWLRWLTGNSNEFGRDLYDNLLTLLLLSEELSPTASRVGSIDDLIFS